MVPQPATTSPPTDYKYWAFISYSHADAKWGDWLHEALETYRVPKRLVGKASRHGVLPARLYPDFRDRDELAGSSRLNQNIMAGLRGSRYLIAICSPRSAASRWVNAEIQAYKAMGREDRVLCVIVDGEPNAAPDSGLLECFPPAVRFRAGSDGQLSSVESEPIAADAREGKDGRKKALLKLLAGLLEVGFDELYQREQVRLRRAKLLRTATFCGIAIAAAALYWGVADAGLKVPGGQALRALQDRHGLTLLRPLYTEATIREAAALRRQELLQLLDEKRLPDGWISATPKDDPPAADLWSHTQAVTGILRARHGDDVRRKFIPSARAPFLKFDLATVTPLEAHQLERDDKQTDKAVPLLWAVTSLATAISTPALLIPEDREKSLRYLDAVQRMLEPYRPTEDGGWNLFPRQKQRDEHHLYSSVLALLMLLELHDAGLGWLGSTERRDAMILATANWLAARFDPTGDPPGWRGIREDIREVYDGLTLQIHGELLRAQAARVGFAIPPVVLEEIPKLLAACAQRDLSFPTDGGEFEAVYLDATGKETLGHEAIKYLWYPWAIDCAVSWLRYARAIGVPKEQIVQVQRALGHLVVDLGETAVTKARTDWTFLTSENLYGFSAVPER
jgi:hypothetical protein